MALTGFIVLAGVKKGIERYTKLMMPLLFVLIVILGIRACTLDGAMEGIKFLFFPKFSELTSRGVLYALGQAFFLTSSLKKYGLYKRLITNYLYFCVP